MQNIDYTGLTADEILQSRNIHGSNTIRLQETRTFWMVLKEIILEPMFGLLLAAAIIYFIVGQHQEGTIMIISIFIVSGISFFQEYRSRNAIHALNKLSSPKTAVIRNGTTIKVLPEEVVVEDIMLAEEGEIVAADGLIVSANDLSVNESILTGETFPVIKSSVNRNKVYKGTIITSGSGIIKVTAVGVETRLGKIGKSAAEIIVDRTPLQLQIRSFVRKMVWIGTFAFVIVVTYHLIKSGSFIDSLMRGLTLAMSILPEEIPVAFSTFLALGAYRLLRNNIIVRQPQYVETLGSATVLCTDKTGTITKNEMNIAYTYDASSRQLVAITDRSNLPSELIEYAMWSSEASPFDPMEIAIHQLYTEINSTDQRSAWKQVHEYPIGGKPPFMTHIFGDTTGQIKIAAKGAPEAIIRQSILADEEKNFFNAEAFSLAKQGFRVLGVGNATWKKTEWPATQQEFMFRFLGLIAFSDPPKENITETLQSFSDAGIKVKMITGDYPETALAIARLVHLKHNGNILTGEQILKISEEELKSKVDDVNIYARMFPEAKVKVINALKENGEVVAMTGDGVNDAPALKAAHIGIAMGQRGSEAAKSSASLIITDDDLMHMTEAIALGRKIYDNLKKAIQYIVSIHIPIILIVALPLFLGWEVTNIFTPVHVIFLELIMGPTCSIIYENEPREPGTMQRPPRKLTETFLTGNQLFISIIQGLFITAGSLGLGYLFINTGHSAETVRTVIFITLLFSNIFLTLENRSFRYSILKTFGYANNMLIAIISITILFIAVMIYVPDVRHLFKLELLDIRDILFCFVVAGCSTLWVELWKYAKRKKSHD